MVTVLTCDHVGRPVVRPPIPMTPRQNDWWNPGYRLSQLSLYLTLASFIVYVGFFNEPTRIDPIQK